MLARFGLAAAIAASAFFATAALANIATKLSSEAVQPRSVTVDRLAAKKCRYSEKYVLSNKYCQLEPWRNANPDCARRYCGT